MNLLVFLTFNKSLKDWHNEGLLEREMKYYQELSSYNNLKITFFSYGDIQDKIFLKNLKNFDVLCLFNTKRSYGSIFNFFYSIFFIFRNLKFFKKFNFVKTNQNYGSWLGVIIKIIYKKTFFISRGGYDLHHFKLLEKKFLKKIASYLICLINYKFADKILITTEFYKKFIIKKFGIEDNKILVLPNYIDTNFFQSNNKLKFKKRILYVGRFIDQKNLFETCKLFSNTGYSLDFLGSGPLKKDLVNYANLINCDLKIMKPIKNEKLPELINKYNFFILNSLYEGNPKVLLEAMSSETVCIGNNTVGINNIIKHKKNGLLISLKFKKNDLLKYLKNNKDMNKIKKNAREFVKQYHNLIKIVKLESNVYK